MKATTACGPLASREQRRVASSCRFELHPPAGRRRLCRGWRSGCRRTSWRTWMRGGTWPPCLLPGRGGRVRDRPPPRGVCGLGLQCWGRQAGGVSGQTQ